MVPAERYDTINRWLLKRDFFYVAIFISTMKCFLVIHAGMKVARIAENINN